MKLDVHITTCHRHDVKCRPRPHEGPNWNVKEWTVDERLSISMLSVDSILTFCLGLRKHGHEIDITLLDDGSDFPKALDWINHLKVIYPELAIKQFPARGSSAGINDHISSLETLPDYVMHIEDDHILFNPLELDWLSIIDKIANESTNIKVFTFRSGLPVEPTDKGFTGAWGPIGSIDAGNVHSILFRKMGNAHHIMRFCDYARFLPLQGSTGGCEEYMNQKLSEIGLNAEPQIHVHAFHSHMLEYPIKSNDLNSWHKSGEGMEMGIEDMHTHLIMGVPCISTVYTKFPTKKESIIFRK